MPILGTFSLFFSDTRHLPRFSTYSERSTHTVLERSRVRFTFSLVFPIQARNKLNKLIRLLFILLAPHKRTHTHTRSHTSALARQVLGILLSHFCFSFTCASVCVFSCVRRGRGFVCVATVQLSLFSRFSLQFPIHSAHSTLLCFARTTHSRPLHIIFFSLVSSARRGINSDVMLCVWFLLRFYFVYFMSCPTDFYYGCSPLCVCVSFSLSLSL